MIEVEDNGQLKFSNHRQITPTPRSLFRCSFKDHLRAFNFFAWRNCGEVSMLFGCFESREEVHFVVVGKKLMFITALVFRDLIVKFDSVNFK